MSQVTRGVRAVFSHPRVYDAFQDVMGATGIREELVREFFRPTPAMRVLDIGCGTGEIVRFLPRDVEYWGFDISAPYIEAAKARLGDRGHFECGLLGARRIDELPRFDLAIALGVLHHLEDGPAQELFTLARRALTPKGRVVTIDPCFVVGQNPIARFLISRDRGQNVRTADAYRMLATSAFGDIQGLIRHRTWIPYTHWVMECKA
jgi:SAM-dependent methyltransferase